MGTLTATVRASKPAVGGDAAPIWPNEINLSFDLFDKAINQTYTLAATDTNQTLEADGTVNDQATYVNLGITGTWTANRTITLPAAQKTGWVFNKTTGGFSAVLTTGSGATITVPNDGYWNFYNCDGTNVTQPNVRFGNIEVSGLSISGTTVLSGSVTAQGNLTVGGPQFQLSAGSNASVTLQNNATPVFVNSAAPPATVFSAYAANLALASCNYALWQFGGTTIGSIGTTGASVSYNTTSDATLKIDDGDLSGEDALALVRKLRPKWFRWKSDPGAASQPGFFAQQVGRFFPWAVTKGRRIHGVRQPWQMDNSRLVPILVAAINELDRRTR